MSDEVKVLEWFQCLFEVGSDRYSLLLSELRDVSLLSDSSCKEFQSYFNGFLLRIVFMTVGIEMFFCQNY